MSEWPRHVRLRAGCPEPAVATSRGSPDRWAAGNRVAWIPDIAGGPAIENDETCRNRPGMAARLGGRPGRGPGEQGAGVAVATVAVTRRRDLGVRRGRCLVVMPAVVMGVPAGMNHGRHRGRFGHGSMPVDEELVGRGGEDDRQHRHHRRHEFKTAAETRP